MLMMTDATNFYDMDICLFLLFFFPTSFLFFSRSDRWTYKTFWIPIDTCCNMAFEREIPQSETSIPPRVLKYVIRVL